MPGLLDDIGWLNAPALGDMPMGEYVDYTALPAPEKKKTATAGLLRFCRSSWPSCLSFSF